MIDNIAIGQKVIIARNSEVIPWNFEGFMDEWLGKVVTILRYDEGYDGNPGFRIFEDPTWIWSVEDADPYIEIEAVTEKELEAILFL